MKEIRDSPRRKLYQVIMAFQTKSPEILHVVYISHDTKDQKFGVIWSINLKDVHDIPMSHCAMWKYEAVTNIPSIS